MPQDTKLVVIKTGILYGAEKFGKLDSVLLHSPEKSLKLVNRKNYHDWRFKKAPDLDKLFAEFEEYRDLLDFYDVQVYELSDYVNENRHLVDISPNLTYLRDISYVTRKGAIVSQMGCPARKLEQNIIKESFGNLGIPILYEFDGLDDAFEGCLFLNKDTLLLLESDRSKRSSISSFIRRAVKEFDEVVVASVHDKKRFLHPDTVINRVTPHLVLAYLPAFEKTFLFGQGYAEEINFVEYLKSKYIDVISITEEEQQLRGCSFVPYMSGILFYSEGSLSAITEKQLARHDVELIPLKTEELRGIGGSLSAHTLELHRDCSFHIG